MLEMPIATKVVPIAIAGMIALAPISPERTVGVLEAAKQKAVTIITREGYTTTIDDKGQQIQLPYKEKITKIDNNGGGSSGGGKKDEKGIVKKTFDFTVDAVKKIYWWVKK